MNLPHDLLQNLMTNKENKKPEEKEEHELNTSDRMSLINKQIDENFLMDTYETFLKRDDVFKENNHTLVNVNNYVFNDVEFLHDHYLNKEKGLFQKLNKCNSKIGSLILQKIFIKPVHDINILKERQNIIKKISLVKDKLKPHYDRIKILETDLIWFWNDNNMRHIDLMNDLIYFNYDFIPFLKLNDVLNSNERALLITNIYKIIVAPIITILTPLLSVIIPLIVLFYFQRKTGINVPIKDTLSMYFRSLFSSDSMKFIFQSPSKAMLASLLTKGVYLFMYIQNIYYSLQSSFNTSKIINIIHDKLNKITEYIHISKKIESICSEADIKSLACFLDTTRVNENISFYETYFNFPVFQKNPGLFTDKGKILYTFKNFIKNKDDITRVFNYTGIIDSLLSIEHVIANSSVENPYTFTKFIKNSTPYLITKDIWHPYLNSSSTVKNDIELKNNILITGPNAAGKSTFIKSVILNIILSQTLGISSSSNFEMTPFKMIETYLHIPDSKGASSLFEAEMFRSKEYIEKIKTLDKDDFSFIVLDEIFSSTNFVEGLSGAYSILKKISSFENTLSITTTHYTDLEVLEKDTSGKVVNYKFEIDYDENKEIIFNYKIKRGVSRQYIALELLKKNNFDDDIIQDALAMCDKIKSKKMIEKKVKKKDKKKNEK
jgi:DNA mismatch repair protein MutS